LTPVPDPDSTNVLSGRFNMTWITTFQIPGELDSRVTRKQGIDTFIKPLNGGLIVLDVGQKTEDLAVAPGEDFNFRVDGISRSAIPAWRSARPVAHSGCRTAPDVNQRRVEAPRDSSADT
jgi:hypothetical protein